MKILVLSQYWHPENGVPQRRWTWLSKILVDAGHEVTVIAPPPHYQRKIELRQWWATRKGRTIADVDEGPSGEKIIRSGFFPAGPSLTQRAVNQATVALGAIQTMLRKKGALRDYRPDLIIGTVPALPTAAATRIVAAVLRRPYLIDLRDAWPDLLQQSDQWNKGTGKTSLREKTLKRGPMQVVTFGTRRVLNDALKHAAGISVTSSYLADVLCEREILHTDGSSPEIVTIRNVFPPLSDRSVDLARKRHDGLNVLYAGTLGRAQNLSNALEAAKIAQERGVTIKLRLVGAGVAREQLTSQARELGIDATVEPRQPAEEMAEFYDWADTALVHLTDWEPLSRAVPSKTYELMAQRMHISGVVSGEAAELIQAHGAGDVVEPEDPQALAELWVELAGCPERLCIRGGGPQWVEYERESVAPGRFLGLVERAADR
ncbi:colanic acid biosynthesis glycosyl transferase wcaI [Corynebacterium maris DSM 45190]|uniref:Colanic acid biosynthesis glycosyl transferase wcaI n=1 Tax=Corynebacterium maris DSM 45190 TaxID=1224163 RepID=S5T407_9CORY|nr:glycosyltransferase family 4 protein [Corynebacterium maris]AGS35385.1 colanic acid biosynthesis glycosyl transferase wcaI [Corynebacterium maris DSM 45190]